MKFWQINPKIRDTNIISDSKPYTNTSMVRATNILICISNGIDTNAEIAEYCKYSTSTVHRFLNVMQNLKWVVKDRINHKYYLGPVINHLLSNQADAHRYLLVNALPEMVRLSRFSRETINLSVLVQLRTVLLHYIPSEQELKIVEADSDQETKLAVGATAKVLLSQLGEEEIKEVMQKVGLLRLTGRNTTDGHKLMAQLREIKKRGYGVSHGERIIGAICISTPVNNYSHPVALSILGPENRIRPRAGEITEELIAGAGRISKSINNNI